MFDWTEARARDDPEGYVEFTKEWLEARRWATRTELRKQAQLSMVLRKDPIWVKTQELKAKVKGLKDDTYVMMTINVNQDDWDIDRVMHFMDRWCRRKRVKDWYCWAIEQRCSNEEEYERGYYWSEEPRRIENRGVHIHVLFKRMDWARSIWIREAYETFGIPWCIPKSQIDYRACGEAMINKKIGYIHGEKIGEKKLNRVFYDKRFRRENKVRDVYKSDNVTYTLGKETGS